ncbi:MAG: hypothetical protein UY16_C0070G0010 [Candidatus Gottesmanbacteria bacterium GW2011_GWA2_47_9]|uniref:Uncharacterized protein n=1 Tax=Candidatus Gottesmanbacteria bacterium GW2011_GWA2_47_9 TaxID=1618445 RepID=A0A0G1TV82_9BACT|nr:MAG: hypothetical protein UY16_C0070G0010 [Candidatus Gottesmanbacteria bacterium GW2011_GWA2_47_9]
MAPITICAGEEHVWFSTGNYTCQSAGLLVREATGGIRDYPFTLTMSVRENALIGTCEGTVTVTFHLNY